MRKVIILFVVLGSFICAGCGGSGASSPVTPAQIPTAVEYAAGDAIIAGALPSVTASVSKADGESVMPTAVYAVSSQQKIKEATIDKYNNFYAAVSVGYSYAIIFLGDGWFSYYFDEGTGLHSVPLNMVTGVAEAGTINFDEDRNIVTAASVSAFKSGDSDDPITVIDLGEPQVVVENETGLSNTVITYTSGEGGITGQTGITEEEAEDIGNVDAPQLTAVNECVREETCSLHIGYITDTDLVNQDLADDDLETIVEQVTTAKPFEYVGYTFYFSPPEDIFEKYTKGYLEAPFDITNGPIDTLGPEYNRGSEIFKANEPIQSTYEGSSSYSFFSTGVVVDAEFDEDTEELITPGYSSSPVIDPQFLMAGDFAFEFGDEDGITSSSDEKIILSVPAAPELSIGQVNEKDVLTGVPHIVPKLVIGTEGCSVASCIVGLEWKMVKMGSNSSWSDVSANTANLQLDSAEVAIRYAEKIAAGEVEGETEEEVMDEIESEILEVAASNHRRFTISIGAGNGTLYSGYFKVNEGGSDPTMAEGSVTFEEPIPIDTGECSPSYLSIFYSIRDYNYGYTISGCLD